MNKHFDEVIAKLSDDPATQTTLAAILAKMISAPATEAKQTALGALIGEVQASPTENTVLDRLKDLATSLGTTNDAPASASADEDTTAKSGISLFKGLKNLLIDIQASLVALKSKGVVTTAHSAITGTATSEEIDCRGYNSLLVHFVSDMTDKTWTISITGAMGSSLTFVPLLDKTTGLIASEITTDISGFFVISNVPDYVKVVCTEMDDGATITCKVQPFNV